VSRPGLRSTQPPVQWVPGVFSRGSSAAEARCWPLTTIYCRGQEWAESVPSFTLWACMVYRDIFTFVTMRATSLPNWSGHLNRIL
jgi:hypothetical protein